MMDVILQNLLRLHSTSVTKRPLLHSQMWKRQMQTCPPCFFFFCGTCFCCCTGTTCCSGTTSVPHQENRFAMCICAAAKYFLHAKRQCAACCFTNDWSAPSFDCSNELNEPSRVSHQVHPCGFWHIRVHWAMSYHRKLVNYCSSRPGATHTWRRCGSGGRRGRRRATRGRSGAGGRLLEVPCLRCVIMNVESVCLASGCTV